jgi:hypothetical protein
VKVRYRVESGEQTAWVNLHTVNYFIELPEKK